MINTAYKLLIVDVDGTLVSKDGTISAEDRDALAKASDLGIHVSLSTGECLKPVWELLTSWRWMAIMYSLMVLW